MDWDEYWELFVDDNKLNSKISEMNEIDLERNGKYMIEDICHTIFDEYPNYHDELEKKKHDLLKIVEDFPGVHLHTSRVKELESLLKKIIEKRSKYLLSDTSLYAEIDGYNYKNILTDLIGLRLIISYRGSWIDLHKKILEHFPYYEDMEEYDRCVYIPHPSNGDSVIAEIPKAYYAYKDNISMYEEAGIHTHLRENGYRSVHYVISFQGIYVEIQTRTIYDEAWSDFDHNYVYKHEMNQSYPALKELSLILNEITNAASGLGEMMRNVYENEVIDASGGMYRIKDGYDLQTDGISDRISHVQDLLDELKKRML